MTGKYSLSKNEIVAKEQPIIRQICESVAGRNQDYHLVDDLVQEINIILLSQLDETIQSLYETGAFKYYVARITTNQVLSNTSPFHKKYRDRGLKDAPIYEDYDEKADKLWQEASKIDHKFSKEVLLLRYEYDLKISEIARLKGVSERYIYKTLSNSQNYLKNILKK
jgi:DNA-directed RNA polymerase specialized sigma24 family protein